MVIHSMMIRKTLYLTLITIAGIFLLGISFVAALQMFWPISNNSYLSVTGPDGNVYLIHNNNCGLSIFFPASMTDFNRATWNRTAVPDCERVILRVPIVANSTTTCPIGSQIMNSNANTLIGSILGTIRGSWWTMASPQINTDLNYIYCQVW